MRCSSSYTSRRANWPSSGSSENVKAGLARARQEGKRLGRPPVSEDSKERIIEVWRRNGSMKKTAKELGKPYVTVHNIVSACRDKADITEVREQERTLLGLAYKFALLSR